MRDLPGDEAFSMGFDPPAEIAAKLNSILAQAPGKVAVACHDLHTAERWALGDDVFPAASLIKVPLAVAAYQAAERGALALTEKVAVAPLADDDEAEFDNLGLAPAGVRHSWRKIIDRMLTESDNAATNALIDKLGFGALSPLEAQLGTRETALRRKMLDRAARADGRENTTTASNMVALFVALAQGLLLSPAHTEELLGLLVHVRDDEKLAAGLPVGVSFAHKTGELETYRHDAGLVFSPDRERGWAVCVLAEGGPSTDALLGDIAGLLYAHFNARRATGEEAVSALAEDRALRLSDPRSAYDTLEVGWDAGELVLKGETTMSERVSAFPLPVRVDARVLTGRPGVVIVPCLQLRAGPGHARELVSQLRLGDPVTLLDEGPDWTLLRGPDGYLAWGKSNNLAPATDWAPSHVVAVPLTLAEADDGRVFQLSAGSRLALSGGRFRLPGGMAVRLDEAHMRPLGQAGDSENVLALAMQLRGLPYLWGGTSGWGIDCSGLVQLTHFVMGAQLPRDADQQQHASEPVEAIAALEPGDLVFFPGHVGLYLGGGAFVHASAQAGMVTVNSFDRDDPRFETWLFENFTGGGRSPLGRAAVRP